MNITSLLLSVQEQFKLVRSLLSDDAFRVLIEGKRPIEIQAKKHAKNDATRHALLRTNSVKWPILYTFEK